MHPNFEDALKNGYLEVAILPDGKPFEHEGVTYYVPTGSGANMFIRRFHAIGDMMQRHDRLKLTDDVLSTSFTALLNLSNEAIAQMRRGDGEAPDLSPVMEMTTIIKRLQFRQNLGLDVATIYELSSIWILSENEDPCDYDSQEGRQKVASWLRKPDLYPFFLSLPVGRMVPLQQLFDGDTPRVLQSLNEEELLDLTRILLLKESYGLTPDTISTLESRRETLFGYDGLLTAASRNTLNTSTATS